MALNENTLTVEGGIHISGAITAPEGTLRDDGGGWVRTYGNTGWYSQTYGGGWYMEDSTWIRSYGSKNIYHNSGILRTDGSLQVGPEGSTLRIDNGGNLAYRTGVLFANTSGNVGIGTAAPQAKLHVEGDIRLQKGATINEISDDGTLADNSNLAVPTEKAVKAYIEDFINKRLKELENKVTEQQKLITALTTRIQTLEGQNQNLTTRIQILEGQNLNNRIAVMEGQNLNTRITNIEVNGVEWANKARMLQARNEDHFMRFYEINQTNHDVFRLWKTDGAWFDAIRVAAADRVQYNDGHLISFDWVAGGEVDIIVDITRVGKIVRK
jgi:hypothetical protein